MMKKFLIILCIFVLTTGCVGTYELVNDDVYYGRQLEINYINWQPPYYNSAWYYNYYWNHPSTYYYFNPYTRPQPRIVQPRKQQISVPRNNRTSPNTRSTQPRR